MGSAVSRNIPVHTGNYNDDKDCADIYARMMHMDEHNAKMLVIATTQGYPLYKLPDETSLLLSSLRGRATSEKRNNIILFGR